ncbi:MAG: glutathione synthase [Gammaproteobacteria bacterium]|nr:glutathione synthase [Gammaproteobacteria bacterium]MCW8986921.1 glutathione synthase [Gammaproteobacteria bacterium]
MSLKIGVVMDPIGHINFKKDSTLAMLLEAQSRGWQLYYMEQADLYMAHEVARAKMQPLKVFNNADTWYQLSEAEDLELDSLDAILMRKDPPFDMNYIYSTYILEKAEEKGTLIINKAQSLRDANEKLFTNNFPQCMPPTLVSSQAEHITTFFKEHKDIILKPLDGMGGASVFRIKPGDSNLSVIIETLTAHGSKLTMAQKFIPEIKQGDKRILLINGVPVPYALARIPAKGETRANLAVGGEGVGVELTDRDRWICEQVAPVLKAKGLIFVGIDVIGDYLTEVNVTSPTCIRELDKQYNINISALLMDWIAEQRAH